MSDGLASLITEKYGLESVDCKLLVKGVGDTYLVESTGDRHILRVYRSSHRHFLQIAGEVEMLLALKREGVSVSYPIPDKTGKFISIVEGMTGPAHAVLFSYAAGEAVKVLNEGQLRNFGREMARFHQVSSAIELKGERWRIDFETVLYQPLEMLKASFDGDAENYAWLRQAVKRVEEKMASLGANAFSEGYCHFDFLPKNLHFEGDAVTFFDFDFMGYGFLAYDITCFWQHLAIEVYAGRMTQSAADQAYSIFLAGYRECRILKEQELAAAPYLTLGFWLFYMGFHTTHEQFYSFAQPAQVKAYVGFLRDVAEKYWRD